MVKLRKQRRRKVYRHNVNRKRMRNKLSSTGTIKCKEIKEAWEAGKSVKNNLHQMGLCYDPNTTIGIKSAKAKKASMILKKGDIWDEEDLKTGTSSNEGEPSKLSVVNALITDARTPRVKMFRLPNSQVEWATYLLDNYKNDYKAMAKDKKNYNQETWKQIRAKIRRFKSIPEQYLPYKEKCGNNMEDSEIEVSDDEV